MTRVAVGDAHCSLFPTPCVHKCPPWGAENTRLIRNTTPIWKVLGYEWQHSVKLESASGQFNYPNICEHSIDTRYNLTLFCIVFKPI